MAANMNIARQVKASAPVGNDSSSKFSIDELIDSGPGGPAAAISPRAVFKFYWNLSTGDDPADFIGSGQQVAVNIASIPAGWDGVIQLLPYTGDATVSATNQIVITDASTGLKTFTVTQAFIDDLVNIDDGEGPSGQRHFAMRCTVPGLIPGEVVLIDDLTDTVEPSAGVKQGEASVTALAVSGGQGGVIRPGAAASTGLALWVGVDSGIGAKRPGATAATATATSTAAGGRKMQGTAAVTAVALVSNAAAGAQRSGASSVVALAKVSNAAAGAKRPSSASVIAVAIVTSATGPIGDIKNGGASVTARAVVSNALGRRDNRQGVATLLGVALVSNAAAGAQRSGASVVSAIARVSGAIGGSKRPGATAVAGRALWVGIDSGIGAKRATAAASLTGIAIVSSSTGGKTGGVLLDKEQSQVLSVALESLSFVSDGEEWWVV